MPGTEHPDALVRMNNLALLLNRQRKSDEAERVHRRTVELYGTVIGPDHPGMLASMNNLAAVLCRQSIYDEAEAIH